MNKVFFIGATLSIGLSIVSCGTQKEALYLELFSPEESGLNLVKITDEANGSVVAGEAGPLRYGVNYANAQCGFNGEHNIGIVAN